jgi:hypothetical protein
MATASTTYNTQAINEDARQVIADIAPAWENVTKNGLELGKRLHKWTCSEAFKPSKGGYNSNGEGLSGILNVLSQNGVNIPRHIADYWLAEYKFKQGLTSVSCTHCEMTFPSNGKMKKHVHIAHSSVKPVEPIVDPVEQPTDAIADAIADVTDSPAFEQVDDIPVATPLTQDTRDISDTKKLQAMFEGTNIVVKASTVKDGLESCQGKFNLVGLTAKHVEANVFLTQLTEKQLKDITTLMAVQVLKNTND